MSSLERSGGARSLAGRDQHASVGAPPAAGAGGHPGDHPGDHPGADPGGPPIDPAALPELVFSVDSGTVRAVADLLELLGDLPSTPERLAGVSTARAGDLTRLLPPGGGMATHAHGSIDLSASLLAAVAGLLERLAGLPSTPPVVADDARSWAAQLWARLDETDPPAGHRNPR